jgi:hypothetical protein
MEFRMASMEVAAQLPRRRLVVGFHRCDDYVILGCGFLVRSFWNPYRRCSLRWSQRSSFGVPRQTIKRLRPPIFLFRRFLSRAEVCLRLAFDPAQSVVESGSPRLGVGDRFSHPSGSGTFRFPKLCPVLVDTMLSHHVPCPTPLYHGIQESRQFRPVFIQFEELWLAPGLQACRVQP